MNVGGITTVRSSGKAYKTYLRMVHNVQLTGFMPKMLWIDNPVIEFSEKDTRPLHHRYNNALVVSILARNYNTHQVLVDNGSSANIFYYPAFQQMMIDRERLVPTNASLVGFGGTRVHPLSAVTLSVTVDDYPQQITKKRNIPCGQLLVRLQCHLGTAYPQFMEGRNFNLPLNGQIPHQL